MSKKIIHNKSNKKIKYDKNNFYDIFWKILISKKIDRVFGLPGGPIDNILSAKPEEILWTNVGNELQNGFMSQIYGQYTNNVGYLFVTTGPGIATAISALEQAIYEGNPLIIVSSVNSKDNVGDFQSWDIKNISKHLTKHFFYIKNKNHMVNIIHKSYEIAKNYNTGVILLFENDIFTTQIYKIPKNINLKQHTIIYNKNNKINKISLINVLEQLNYKNTLLVIGKLKPYDYTSLITFIKINNIPFVTTWKGRFFINDDVINCGRLGTLGKHSANYAIYNASHLLILGNVSGLLNNTSYKNKFSVIFTQHKHIISLCYNKDHALQIGNIYEINNLSLILKDLHINVDNSWRLQLSKSNSILNIDLPCISKLEKFAYIAAKVYKNNKLTLPVTTGVGNHWYAIGKYMDIEQPNSFESATQWASIGIGISNGIAIHYATNKPIWVFEGDGGSLFSSSDLLYLLNNPQLPITITIYINHIYGAISEDYENKCNKFNEVVQVPNIPILKILPNCHIFNDPDKYFNYLNHNCYSDKIRFIIILLPNTITSNNVYEINIDSEYEHNIKNDMFNNILKTKMIL